MAFFAFCYLYPHAETAFPPSLLRVVVTSGSLFTILSLFTPLMIYDGHLTDEGFRHTAGILYVPFAFFIIGSFGSGIVILVRKSRPTAGIARLQLHYVLAGAGLPIAGTITTNLLLSLVTSQSTYSLLEPLFLLPFVLLVAHAVIRYRLMDLRLAFHCGLVAAIATLALTTPMAALLLLWHPFFRDYDGVPLFLSLIFAALLISPTKTYTSKLLNRYAYRTQTDFRQTVRSASRRLTELLDLRMLLSFVSETLMQSIETEGACVYLARGSQFVSTATHLRKTALTFSAPVLTRSRWPSTALLNIIYLAGVAFALVALTTLPRTTNRCSDRP